MKKIISLALAGLITFSVGVGCGKDKSNLNIKEDFVTLHSITYQKYYAETHEQDDTHPDKTRQEIFSPSVIPGPSA